MNNNINNIFIQLLHMAQLRVWVYDCATDQISYVLNDGTVEESMSFQDHMNMKCPEDWPEIYKSLEFISKELKPYPYPIRWRYFDESQPDGFRHTENNIYPIVEDGKLLKVYGTEQDISASYRRQKAAEDESREKSIFLARASHDIRNPLNAILSISEMMCDAESVEERKELFEVMKTSEESLRMLIADILDLSRIDSGVVSIQKTEFNVKKLILGVITSFKLQDGGSHTIQFVDESESSMFFSDYQRISQILNNYISNAIKYSSKGTVVTITLRNSKLDGLYVSVRDEGCGMSEKNRSDAFKEFTRFNSDVPGTGLGLSICKRLIQQLGGDVGVESKLGVGSTFWFHIR
ncbi:MAG: HAMP domain-containing histidine kinase [Bacteroidaceae bacterium]|nr:HAMP domain-containing histidine kinase [Bacteroidaceae bacterium]